MSDRSLPRWAEKILESLGADPDFRDDVLGDLAEEHALRVHWDGPQSRVAGTTARVCASRPISCATGGAGVKLKDAGYLAGAVVASSILVVALDGQR